MITSLHLGVLLFHPYYTLSDMNRSLWLMSSNWSISQYMSVSFCRGPPWPTVGVHGLHTFSRWETHIVWMIDRMLNRKGYDTWRRFHNWTLLIEPQISSWQKQIVLTACMDALMQYIYCLSVIHLSHPYRYSILLQQWMGGMHVLWFMLMHLFKQLSLFLLHPPSLSSLLVLCRPAALCCRERSCVTSVKAGAVPWLKRKKMGRRLRGEWDAHFLPF